MGQTPGILARAYRKYRRTAAYIIIAYILVKLALSTFLADVDPMVFIQIGMAFVMQIGQVLMYFGFFFWFLGGRIRCTTYLPGDLALTWDDFVGSEAVLERAKLIVGMLTQQHAAAELGGVRPAHMMFHGAPGTGKTYLAQIIAAMAGAPVMVVEASSLLGTFIGIGPLKVINLFKKLKKLATIWDAAIMFVDEIDTIGGARGGTGTGIMSFIGGNVGGQILNVMLSCISGISEPAGPGHRLRTWLRKNLGIPYRWQQPNVIIIGSTNKNLATLDAALIRPGRLEEHIEFPLPNRHDLELLIDYYLSRRVYDLGGSYGKMVGVPHANDCKTDAMAWIAQGTSQAGVERAINSAKRLAAAQTLNEINLELWTQAITEAMFGLKQPMPLTERDTRLLSIHEAGHVYAAKVAGQVVPFATIDRYGGGGNLGHIRHMPEEQHVLATGRDIEEALVVSLASLAAEELLGERTPGTAADLDNVRRLTLLLISQGMIGDPWMLDQPKETGGQTVGAALPIAQISDKGRKVAAEYFRFRKAELLQAMDEERRVLEDLAALLAEKKAVKDKEIEECIAGRLKLRELERFEWKPENNSKEEVRGERDLEK